MKPLLILFCVLAGTPVFSADLGTDANPIKCNQPSGEGWYLSRLRLPSGEKLEWSRLGSGGGPADEGHQGHIFDIFQSSRDHELIMCMYHPQYVEIMAPGGFRLLFEWSDNYEYVDGKLHRLGEKKPFTGKIEETFEDEKETLIVELKEGLIQGSLTFLYLDKTTKLEIEYGEENRPHGTKTRYHENGDLFVKYTFRNGILHGPFQYLPKDKTKSMTGSYDNGVMKKDE